MYWPSIGNVKYHRRINNFIRLQDYTFISIILVWHEIYIERAFTCASLLYVPMHRDYRIVFINEIGFQKNLWNRYTMTQIFTPKHVIHSIISNEIYISSGNDLLANYLGCQMEKKTHVHQGLKTNQIQWFVNAILDIVCKTHCSIRKLYFP